ncbi:MAG: lipoprotein-releasing system transmembrane subunit LolC, partial [Candidatus Krumholzibacteria bacterium]|nr:lipoprotein-releasing system transmembrane subunit LolC [Candidatus Krumholzibacteria bacterium]
WFQHHPLPLPWDLFIVDRLPLIMKPVDFLLVAGLSLLVSLLATLYPGWEAARLNPIEAIRKA